ncbi:GIY-YIG catalytic domain-containing protein [Neorhodopirellula lusitana]|uniref:GIY-YIG catalytic domain-containing protein n=1 Tax=Neorhodopirellula lusitana TaxID=445327 RepID=A0ABY1QMU6_9BACT|nr:GIY-YIG nuclease family protein [Neorhodopirellula lusitana]SMP75804.1 GIY-YIG catalytic domain-containing protein [Neorhodopirellula lusitana]
MTRKFRRRKPAAIRTPAADKAVPGGGFGASPFDPYCGDTGQATGPYTAPSYKVPNSTTSVKESVIPWTDDLSDPDDAEHAKSIHLHTAQPDYAPQPALATRPNELVGGATTDELRQAVLDLCPPVPGVYGMFDRTGDLIYVGKSRSLRHRLMSYFSDSSAREKAGRIIRASRAIQWETQPSDFAAQLRELNLIRRWTPRFNVQGVPQRQRPVYLCLGRKPAETFYVATSPPTQDVVAVEGPFYGVTRMGGVCEALNKTFGLRDCSQQTVFHFSEQLTLFNAETRPGCLRLEIGTCLGPCVAACSRTEYLQRVSAAQSFIDGFNDEPLANTQEIMEKAAANRQYELAGRARDTLRSLNYARKKLTYLADARQAYSFVYAATGYDGRAIWYLIRRGEVVDVAAAPTDAESYRQMKPLLKSWDKLINPQPQAEHPSTARSTTKRSTTKRTQTKQERDNAALLPDESTVRLSGFVSEHPYTVSVVASWFKKHCGELKQTFAPRSAGRRYRHLARVGVTS